MKLLPRISFISALLLFAIPLVSAGTTPPTTLYSITPATSDGNNGWYVSPVTIELVSTDLESGVKDIHYRLDGGTWQISGYSDTLNLVPNPSFETPGATSSGLDKWEASVLDGAATYTQDTTTYLSGYESSSAKIDSTGGSWHGINNQLNFVPASPYENMHAEVWLKSPGTSGQSRFRIYGIDNIGSTQLLVQSSQVIGKAEWTRVALDFVASMPNLVGVYMDIGIAGNGTLWIDGATLNSSISDTATTFIVATDNSNHIVEYYAVDNVGNIETTKSFTFKLDGTKPGNWSNSGAFRQIPGPSDHQLFVFTNVSDTVSGLGTASNIYQYSTDNNPTFGIYSDVDACNTSWLEGSWAALGKGVTADGDSTAYLETQRTNFCNSDWKICKNVKFYAEDIAGNNVAKSFCINGPWIRLSGGGTARSDNVIDMLSEGTIANADGLIEVSGSSVDFFSTSTNWVARNVDPNYSESVYDVYNSLVGNKISLGASLVSSSGVYSEVGNFEISGTTLPNDYDNNTFNQIVFINGDLKISTDIILNTNSAALFVVSGKVEIDEKVENVEVAILADGEFYTAYNANISKATKTLILKGIYSAKEFVFQRTLQGTNNEDIPSEDFVYEPKYLVKLNQFFGNSFVTWKSVK